MIAASDWVDFQVAPQMTRRARTGLSMPEMAATPTPHRAAAIFLVGRFPTRFRDRSEIIVDAGEEIRASSLPPGFRHLFTLRCSSPFLQHPWKKSS
jgi:hypothetical protein